MSRADDQTFSATFAYCTATKAVFIGCNPMLPFPFFTFFVKLCVCTCCGVVWCVCVSVAVPICWFIYIFIFYILISFVLYRMKIVSIS